MTEDKRISLLLTTGGRGSVLEAQGDRAVLETSRAYPHGSTVLASIEGTEHNLRLKVFRCKKVAETDGAETFRVEGRLEGATRALRALLSGASS